MKKIYSLVQICYLCILVVGIIFKEKVVELVNIFSKLLNYFYEMEKEKETDGEVHHDIDKIQGSIYQTISKSSQTFKVSIVL